MTANAFDTLKAAKSLKAAGFDESQAEAVVATVGDAVREHTTPLASTIAVIADRMATKEDVAAVNGRLESVEGNVETVTGNVESVKRDLETVTGNVESVKRDLETVTGNVETVKRDLETVKDRVETISETMATKEYVTAAIAVEMKALYRHLWVMGSSFVAVTVALVKRRP